MTSGRTGPPPGMNSANSSGCSTWAMSYTRELELHSDGAWRISRQNRHFEFYIGGCLHAVRKQAREPTSVPLRIVIWIYVSASRLRPLLGGLIWWKPTSLSPITRLTTRASLTMHSKPSSSLKSGGMARVLAQASEGLISWNLFRWSWWSIRTKWSRCSLVSQGSKMTKHFVSPNS